MHEYLNKISFQFKCFFALFGSVSAEHTSALFRPLINFATDASDGSLRLYNGYFSVAAVMTCVIFNVVMLRELFAAHACCSFAFIFATSNFGNLFSYQHMSCNHFAINTASLPNYFQMFSDF